MANYTSTEDIILDVLARAGEQTDGTSDFDADALRWINRVYQDLWQGGGPLAPDIQEDWWWIRADPPGVLTLEPIIETGTVSVTNNSTTATLSASQAKDVANWFLKIEGHPDIFRISAHGGASAALTLDSVYTGDTDTTAAYKLFKLEYDLASDVLEVSGPMRAYRSGRKEIKAQPDVRAMDERWPLADVEGGVPQAFAAIAEKKVRFSHYGGTDGSTDLMRIEYDYDKEASDLTDSSASIPLMPREFRSILVDGPLFYIWEAKNDSRANGAAAQARLAITAMQRAHRRRMVATRSVGRIAPRLNRTARFRGPLRTESGLIIG